jgi:hypothetical protein
VIPPECCGTWIDLICGDEAQMRPAFPLLRTSESHTNYLRPPTSSQSAGMSRWLPALGRMRAPLENIDLVQVRIAKFVRRPPSRVWLH